MPFMGYNFAAAEPGQLFLLPPDPREWLICPELSGQQICS
jgi:hypothetical protein